MPNVNVLVVAPITSWTVLQPQFHGAPCAVLHTNVASSALRMVSERRIDAVIADATLPGELSLELLRLLARLHPSVFRVLLTPLDDLSTALRARREGFSQRFLLQGGSRDHLHNVLAEAHQLARPTRFLAAANAAAR